MAKVEVTERRSDGRVYPARPYHSNLAAFLTSSEPPTFSVNSMTDAMAKELSVCTDIDNMHNTAIRSQFPLYLIWDLTSTCQLSLAVSAVHGVPPSQGFVPLLPDGLWRLVLPAARCVPAYPSQSYVHGGLGARPHTLQYGALISA